MITYVIGNIFDSNAQVKTNPVNCIGVMGKGLAQRFKIRYPSMFIDYQRRCDAHEVVPGVPYLYEDGKIQILNFPTKRHWKDSSILSNIEDGLKYLAKNYDSLGIYSIAIPRLGCGNGGLRWEDVRTLIEKYLGNISDLDVYVYEPKC